MKLYWRYKKGGKWTWKAARIHAERPLLDSMIVMKEEEE